MIKLAPMSRATTTPIAAFASGNPLFETAVRALRLNEAFTRRILGQVFASVGTPPDHASADELGLLLPEIERRMLLALPFETAAPAMARLRRMLLSWEDD
jgi:hypothetical protein